MRAILAAGVDASNEERAIATFKSIPVRDTADQSADNFGFVSRRLQV